MIRFQVFLCSVFVCCAGILIPQTSIGEDIYRKRFNPPRADFMHGNMIKNGVASGIKGQDNFLTTYIAPIKNKGSRYKANGFTYTLLLPAFVQMLDTKQQKMVITKTTFNGKPYQKVIRKLDAKQVQLRCLKAAYGIEETLWYRLNAAKVPDKPQVIRMTLKYNGKVCSTTKARLKVFEELKTPPPVASEHFKFYLHGLRYRSGHYDGLADWLRKAGNNAVLFRSTDPEATKAMKKRGFYTIAQRSGSYLKIYREFQKSLNDGPAWFVRQDGGQMKKCLPYADAVLWDFEPRPSQLISPPADAWSIREFRKAANIPSHVTLNKKIIKTKYIKQWIAYRQHQFAILIKHWANFCRTINPQIETIVTEGRSNLFTPSKQIDYRNYASYVTYCDPMNTNMLSSVYGMKQWMNQVPKATFLGCQNLAHPGREILYGQKNSMLQILSSVLIGCKGNSIFPGLSMDAADFVVFNRVMGFIGRNQKIIFEGQPDPKNVSLLSTLKREAVQRVYSTNDGREYLAIVCNWHKKNSSHLMLKINKTEGKWLLLDEENRKRFTLNGNPAISSAALAGGIRLSVPASDYRGFRLRRFSKKELARTNDFRTVKLNGKRIR